MIGAAERRGREPPFDREIAFDIFPIDRPIKVADSRTIKPASISARN
jgi:hypothetical protein